MVPLSEECRLSTKSVFDDDDEVRSRKWGCATFKYLTAEAQRRAQPQGTEMKSDGTATKGPSEWFDWADPGPRVHEGAVQVGGSG